jgi:hypothetical protein
VCICTRRGREAGSPQEGGALHLSVVKEPGVPATPRMVSLPSSDPNGPGYRRLRYIRYADDHLLGFAGPKAEAKQIKQRLARFLRDELRLELSQDKTLITHVRTGQRGFSVTRSRSSATTRRRTPLPSGQRSDRTPCPDVIKAKCPLSRARKTREEEGPDQQKRPCDRCDVRDRLPGHSPVLPAYRRRLSATPAAMGYGDVHAQDSCGQAPFIGVEDGRRHRARIDTPNGPRVCFEARIERKNRKPLVARFGIPLQRQRTTEIAGCEPAGWTIRRRNSSRDSWRTPATP